jgi:hypothetical protein
VSQKVLTVKYLPPRRRRRRPPPGDDGECMYEVTYYLGRRERDTAGDGDGEYTYEIWVVAELQPAEAAPAPPLQPSVDRELSPESASILGKDLKAAIDEAAAGRVEGMVWKIDDLSEGPAADLIDLPDRLQALAVKPLDDLAGTAGLPAPVASFSSDVAGTMLLKPIMEPVESVLHGLEIVGTITALLTGAHGLLVTCLKHLIHDKLGGMLSDAFGRAISAATEGLGRQPSATAAPEAVGAVTGAATESPQSSIGPVSAYSAPAPAKPVEASRQAQRLIEEGTLIAGGGQGSASVAGHPDDAGISALRATVTDDQLDEPRAVSGPISDLNAS